MYAIVEIAGQQFKVVKDQKLFVHRLEVKKVVKLHLITFFYLQMMKKYL